MALPTPECVAEENERDILEDIYAALHELATEEGGVGSVLSATVREDGWTVEVEFEGFTTGLTNDFGYDGDGFPTADTPFLTVVSEGYDNTGTLGTTTRTVYLTRALQLAYPNENTANETAAGGNVTAVYALSSYVHLDDNTGAGKSGTAPTITIPAGFATNSGGAGETSLAITNGSVTNNSTQDYANVIARFVSMPYQRLTGPFAVDVMAFHRSAKNTTPCACVKFTFSDGTVTRTQTAVGLSISVDADNLPNVLSASDDAANFTQGANVTCRIQAFPYVGDADNVRDSSANAWPSMDLANFPVGVCDKTGAAYPPVYCAVSAGGNDTTGIADLDAPTAEATPCLTVSRAMKKIQDFRNANLGQNTVDGGYILLIGGGFLYGVGGETINVHTTLPLTITRSSATSRANAQIVGPNATSRFGSRLMRLYDMSVVPSSQANQLIGFGNNSDIIQVEDITATGQGGTNRMFSLGSGLGWVFWKNVTMTGYLSGMSTGNDCSALLARGCTVSGATAATATFGNVRSVVGCSMLATADVCSFYRQGGTLWTDNGNIIVAMNSAFVCRGYFFTLLAGGTLSDVAMVCNLAERIGADPGPLMEVSDATLTNYIEWHSTLAGDRGNYQNDIVAPFVNKNFVLCSFKYCSQQWYTTKGDVFDQDATMIGAWPYSDYCVDSVGNNSELNPDSFFPRYFGIGGTRATTAGYTDDQSKTGGAGGNGDYHPAVGSVLINKIPVGEAVILYDQDGNQYDNTGAGTAGIFQA